MTVIAPLEGLDTLLRDIYERLLAAYGPQGWWPADSPFEVMVGSILTQNTSWINVERAIASLKEANALTPVALRELPCEDIAQLIRSSGYFNMKAKKLQALGEYLGRYDDDLDALFESKPMDELRQEVLGIHGVGNETADSMLLYAGNLPTFVVDAYTMRTLERLGILKERQSYRDVQRMFHDGLPRDTRLFNEFHALIVRHGKGTCRARNPSCDSCPLLDGCATGQKAATA